VGKLIMTQQAPQQRPQRQRQQGQYPPQQGYQQQPQYPPQQAYPPTPQYQQVPVQAPTQPQRGGNPLLTGLKWLFWPFLKVGGWILGLFNVIIHEILRSAVRMVFSVIFFGIFIGLGIAYFMALTQTNYNYSEAIPVMIQNIMGLFGQ
jgi:hypothetical protein